jgi:hypothetical protein
VAALVASFLGFSATAAEPFQMNSVMLLQPESVLEERVSSVESLASFISQVQAAAAAALADMPLHPASGHLIFAGRPGGQSMVWLDVEPELPQQTASTLKSALLRVRGVEVRSGVIVFALNASFGGRTAV